eukprot:583083-Rhodomonas_salina.2
MAVHWARSRRTVSRVRQQDWQARELVGKLSCRGRDCTFTASGDMYKSVPASDVAACGGAEERDEESEEDEEAREDEGDSDEFLRRAAPKSPSRILPVGQNHGRLQLLDSRVA